MKLNPRKVNMRLDYYPFGMLMPGRSNNSGNYRFGFNGKESDNEVKGTGNQQDYGMRIYDTRLSRFLSLDPLVKQYPWLTPYQFASNQPISSVDIDGMESNNDMTPGTVKSFQKAFHDPHGLKVLFEKPVDQATIKRKEQAIKKIEDADTYVRTLTQGTVDAATLPLETGGDILSTAYYGITGDYKNAKISFAAIFIPFASNGVLRIGLKGFERLPGIRFGERIFENADVFRDAVKNSDNKINAYKSVAEDIASQNGWTKNKSLMNKNGNRTIYSDKKGTHFALDTETGSFEVVNKNGKHQGEINFDGVKISDADKSGKHDLIVK